MDVGIRELKARLSELIDRAGRGEIIRVTDRGRPKAIIAPIPGRLRIEEGIGEGWIRPPGAERPRSVRRVRSERSVQEMLDEDRAE